MLTQSIDAIINLCYFMIRENVLEAFYVRSI